ncbi:hypothetical protein BDV97DRAFT_297140 [Delphinella strobiligena]|nr:hypothetical protein BDV97DRAFT_297140 [Delphinella strobiligena]
MATPTAQTVRRWVMTGSVAAITATGAWYGAGLKTQQEFKQEKKVIQEASPTDRIEQLEVTRTDLLRRKKALERKLEELSARNPKAQDQS